MWGKTIASSDVGAPEISTPPNISSCAITNLSAAYGLDLPWSRDSSGNGFPDVLHTTSASSGSLRQDSIYSRDWWRK